MSLTGAANCCPKLHQCLIPISWAFSNKIQPGPTPCAALKLGASGAIGAKSGKHSDYVAVYQCFR